MIVSSHLGIYRKEFGTGKDQPQRTQRSQRVLRKSPVPSLCSLRSLRLKKSVVKEGHL
jgi:hypothetical protein